MCGVVCVCARVRVYVRAKRLSTRRIGTWNTSSLVDTEGSVEVASQTVSGES